MGDVVRLKTVASSDMAQGVADAFANGDVSPADKSIFIFTKGNGLEIGFIQNSMDAHAAIGLLEIAKHHIYLKFIAKD